ncbi:hypothetical protein BKA70DRAFT_1266475 [Coprinopsis sp. MPI-PUGE-AT-0042]|nr:hypothetical protein BKA70DRAFT_1266475 [Coprinopsis sp. MPI-PUGE-AT-0042]
MAPAVAPGEPKASPKPEPLGSQALVFLITTCTLCGLFILWRRADALKRVVSVRLKNLTTRSEGRIRLSEDNGPASTEFLGDDFDEDNEHIGDSDTLTEQMRRATQAWREPSPSSDHSTAREAVSPIPHATNLPPPPPHS